MPQFVDFVQGSESWLAWREGGIGCSEIAAVMEESPWETAYGLWLLKTKQTRPKKQTRAMAHGVESEAKARQWYMSETGLELGPVCAIHDDFDFVRASVDGWNARLCHGVEIKCPTSATVFRRAKEGHIPWYYMLQMQGEMEVLDAADWDYCVWFEGEGVITSIERNPIMWEGEMLPSLMEFWRRVEACWWPQPEGEAFEQSEEWRLAAVEWLEAQMIIAEAEDRERQALATLRRLSAARRTSGANLSTRWEQWRPRSTVSLTTDTPEQAERVLNLIQADPDIMEFVRRDKDGAKLWQTDYAPNLVLKIEAKK